METALAPQQQVDLKGASPTLVSIYQEKYEGFLSLPLPSGL